MLVENTMPNNRSIGTLYLIPGVNQVDKAVWDALMREGYKRPVKGLIDNGTLIIVDESQKITIGLVKKTYDVETLEGWLDDARGPLKGAIKKQIAEMTEAPKEEAV